MRWLDGIPDSMDKFEQAPGDSEGEGSLACCSPQGHKVSDATERLSFDFLSLVGEEMVYLFNSYLLRTCYVPSIIPSFFLFSVLLKYNFHTMTFIHFKYTIQ